MSSFTVLSWKQWKEIEPQNNNKIYCCMRKQTLSSKPLNRAFQVPNNAK